MSLLIPEEIQECMTTSREVMGEGRDLEWCFATEIETALLKKLYAGNVKTWKDWVSFDSSGFQFGVTEAIQDEIDELRAALALAQESGQYMIDKTGYMDVEVLVDEFVKVKQESKDEISRLEREIDMFQVRFTNQEQEHEKALQYWQEELIKLGWTPPPDKL